MEEKGIPKQEPLLCYAAQDPSVEGNFNFELFLQIWNPNNGSPSYFMQGMHGPHSH